MIFEGSILMSLYLYHGPASFGGDFSIVDDKRDGWVRFDDLEFCRAYWSDKIDLVARVMEGNRVAVQFSLLRNDRKVSDAVGLENIQHLFGNRRRLCVDSTHFPVDCP